MRLLTAISTIPLLLTCTIFQLPAEDAELPRTAIAALEKLEKNQSKLTADYKKAVVTQRSKTIDELEKVLKDVTKTGNLEVALAVKKKIDELQALNEAEYDTDLLGQKKSTKLDPAQLIIGKWDYQKTNTVVGTMEFMPNGNVTGAITSPGQYPYIPGKWVVKDDKIVITWVNDQTKVYTLTFTAVDKLSGDTYDVGTNSLTATKQGAK